MHGSTFGNSVVLEDWYKGYIVFQETRSGAIDDQNFENLSRACVKWMEDRKELMEEMTQGQETGYVQEKFVDMFEGLVTISKPSV